LEGRNHLRWGNNGGLANTQTHDEPSGKNLTIAAIGGDVNNNSNDPNKSELSRSPDTTNSVAGNESNQSSSDAANLNHSGDVSGPLSDSIGVGFRFIHA
jgi:hypothetical protein